VKDLASLCPRHPGNQSTSSMKTVSRLGIAASYDSDGNPFNCLTAVSIPLTASARNGQSGFSTLMRTPNPLPYVVWPKTTFASVCAWILPVSIGRLKRILKRFSQRAHRGHQFGKPPWLWMKATKANSAKAKSANKSLFSTEMSPRRAGKERQSLLLGRYALERAKEH
jgi:hypothetical protein